MKTGAGGLDRRLAFDARSSVADGAGNFNAAFVEQFVCAAQVSFLKGGETVLASRLEGVQPVVVRIRKSRAAALITSDWRARDIRRGTIYNVRAVNESEDRHYFELLCDSGRNEG